MTAAAALEEFSKFSVQVFENASSNPTQQTERLTRAIEGILERHGVAKDTKLISVAEPPPRSKL
jgi:hypothetical protein